MHISIWYLLLAGNADSQKIYLLIPRILSSTSNEYKIGYLVRNLKKDSIPRSNRIYISTYSNMHWKAILLCKRIIIMKTYTRRFMFALPFYGGAISGDKDSNVNHARLKNYAT